MPGIHDATTSLTWVLKGICLELAPSAMVTRVSYWSLFATRLLVEQANYGACTAASS
jgi:hypothetical protein